ncbi:TIGR03085 family metal-binding protein [Cellulomonas aerilata]|uniref:TIGR03085 family protein n=1 Tax=Cellulomonas aerilata TaxID=515326 RepID=A0A512DFX9_9CELL|nr:TIGR03085 family metal-binding protein [Cellulomonas aerilata]GEO35403.1 TIGR03085 family protein [Cellulomonas aerilata]
MPWHPVERAALAHALREAGPDAPTLCTGWRSRHLAAHVVLRESAPLVAAGAALPLLNPHAERRIAELGDRSGDWAGYAALVARVDRGPARLSPAARMGDGANLLEFFIHTEDVRRGAGQGTPRALEPAHAEALWARLSRSAPLLYRRAGVGVVLVVPGGPRKAVRRPRGDAGTVIVRGEVGELALHAFGRASAAHVDVLGDPADVDVLVRSHSGI